MQSNFNSIYRELGHLKMPKVMFDDGLITQSVTQARSKKKKIQGLLTVVKPLTFQLQA